MHDKRIPLSISISELREKHGIELDFSPNTYKLDEIFDAIVRQVSRRHNSSVADDKRKKGNNQKRKDKKKNISQKYLKGTKAIQEKYKCSFEEAEKILMEKKTNEKLKSF